MAILSYNDWLLKNNDSKYFTLKSTISQVKGFPKRSKTYDKIQESLLESNVYEDIYNIFEESWDDYEDYKDSMENY